MSGPDTREEAFLAAIRDEPDDDGLRLVYADWLEEHGDAARAELIRVQVEQARSGDDSRRYYALEARQRVLLNEHERAWAGSPPSGVIVRFHRGLLAVRCGGQVFGVPRMREWWQQHGPRVEGLRLMSCHDATLGRLAADGTLDRVPRLNLSLTFVKGKGVPHLARLWRLRELDLTRLVLSDADLAPLAALKGLRALRLDGIPLNGTGLAALAGLEELRELSLDGTAVTNEGLPHLAGLGRLRELGLHATQVTSRGLPFLAGLAGLEELDLSRTGVTVAGLRHLAALPRLARLDLSQTRITDADLEPLSALLPRLRHLVLLGTRITPRGEAALRRAMPQLAVNR
jgi:uncharacterized protein (TIGR02996 family)